MGVSKHEKTDENFIVFECLETPMKHEAQVFEIASQSKLKLRSRQRKKSLKSMLIKIRFPNHRHGYDFLCFNLLNYFKML